MTIIDQLKSAYAENPAKALNLLPELFRQADEGKIVELPCKVGDTVYVIVSKKCGFWQDGYSYRYEIIPATFIIEMINDIGKIVFLTVKEAEQVLKKLSEL